MTWSIIARDAAGAFGIAIASRFFAVGALCPHAARGVGALATQALMNPLYGSRGLGLLAGGARAADVVAALTAPDEGRDHRQVHVIDAGGTGAAYTGAACIDWCGHLVRDGFSVAGNMLAGPRVLDDTAAAFAATAGLPFAERLIASHVGAQSERRARLLAALADVAAAATAR